MWQEQGRAERVPLGSYAAFEFPISYLTASPIDSDIGSVVTVYNLFYSNDIDSRERSCIRSNYQTVIRITLGICENA